MTPYMAAAKHDGHTEDTRTEIPALQESFLAQLYDRHKIARSDFVNVLLDCGYDNFLVVYVILQLPNPVHGRTLLCF